jgi:hypothetical protein
MAKTAIVASHAMDQESCGVNMSITVKKLIAELEKIENKFLEVEVCHIGSWQGYMEIDRVKKIDKKVIIYTVEAER